MLTTELFALGLDCFRPAPNGICGNPELDVSFFFVEGP